MQRRISPRGSIKVYIILLLWILQGQKHTDVLTLQSWSQFTEDWNNITAFEAVFTPQLFSAFKRTPVVLLLGAVCLGRCETKTFGWSGLSEIPNELQSSLDPLRSDLCLTKLPGVQCKFELNTFLCALISRFLWFLNTLMWFISDMLAWSFVWNMAKQNEMWQCSETLCDLVFSVFNCYTSLALTWLVSTLWMYINMILRSPLKRSVWRRWNQTLTVTINLVPYLQSWITLDIILR